MKRLILMLTFLTRIPIKVSYKFEKEDFVKGIVLMPLVGLIIGSILWGFSFVDKFIDRPIICLFIWVIYIWITGGLHIDGLSDSIDGLFSNRDRERTLEIMKDSRVGAFGVLSIILVLALNVMLTYYIDFKLLLLVPVVGRSCALLSCSISKYARKGAGMGKDFIEYCGFKEGLVSVLFPIIIILVTFNYKIIIPVLITILFTMFIVKYIKDRLDGMTGDTIGFIIEITQTAFILFTYIFTRGMII